MHTCQRQLLSAHLREYCQYEQVACSEEGCDEKVLRKDLGRPSHDCIHRIFACDACGSSIKAVDRDVSPGITRVHSLAHSAKIGTSIRLRCAGDCMRVLLGGIAPLGAAGTQHVLSNVLFALLAVRQRMPVGGPAAGARVSFGHLSVRISQRLLRSEWLSNCCAGRREHDS